MSGPDDLSAPLPDVFAPTAAIVDPALPLEVFRARDEAPARPVAERDSRRLRAAGEPGTLRPGAIVGKFRIEELLGTGGFALVYRATHLLLHSTVALKLLRPDVVARRPQLAAQLLQEARFAARIDHPNVVRVLDVTHDPGLTFIVMEFIDGTSLARSIAERGALSPSSVVRIGLDTIDGLQAGLDKGLIHRDIKPPNILLTRTGTARIVDLGLANPIGDRDEGPLRGSTVVGTRGYMSPEQIAEPNAADFRSDIFSLGVTLLEAATGQSPNDLRARGAVTTTVPDGLARVLAWMVEDDPHDRPSSYRELRLALTDVRAQLQRTSSISERGEPNNLDNQEEHG